MALTEGTPAPKIETVDQNGNRVTLDFRGTTVLYFYPKDDTPGCTAEACAFRDDLGEFERRGVKVYGVSTDDAESHQRFAKKYGLNFTLLADPEKKISRAYDVLNFMGFAQRVTFIIKDGVIVRVFPKVSPNGHSREVLQTLERI
ncbi:MAG: peroxiredoxin [Candidatus Bipolaricaulota bacterium]|nr:peroxiredoxin [Candidatus Bipolaricaulota bacterium]MCS7274569.1 peroxiredoxin [Candidatus Bipolaricaulota bacterium]MDW8111000.1 peroxiredoxin [Candidatus Bipolaricaulota bacterium]MDW8329840.1 peroxiredoxin [Candidatus Bipolaricaulota bacterium]